MQIIKKELKQGEITIRVDGSEDLWYLSQLIEPNDTIKGKTQRKIKATEEAQGERKWVMLAITVEKVDFSKTTHSLRVGGVITEGPEDVPRGTHHTFAVEKNSVITIKKEWRSYHLDRLKEAAELNAMNILVCAFDRDEALFAKITKTGYDVLTKIKGEVPAKRIQTKTQNNFYEQIIKKLEDYDQRYKLDHIILASPAFWKEELLRVLTNESIKKKTIHTTCSSVSGQALDEILKRSEVQTALQNERIAQELELVEKIMTAIARQGNVVYGLQSVKEATEAGATKVFVVTEGLILRMRQESKYDQLDLLLRTADEQRAKIVIISSDHDGGKKLDGIGGVAALLRFKLS